MFLWNFLLQQDVTSITNYFAIENYLETTDPDPRKCRRNRTGGGKSNKFTSKTTAHDRTPFEGDSEESIGVTDTTNYTIQDKLDQEPVLGSTSASKTNKTSTHRKTTYTTRSHLIYNYPARTRTTPQRRKKKRTYTRKKRKQSTI
eukprot:3699953-Ditylum_brightwellii.AAC.1